MMLTIGHCANTTCCSLASAGRDVHVRSGDSFVCPQCGRGLAGPAGPPRGRGPLAMGTCTALAFIAVNAGSFVQGQSMLRGAEFVQSGAAAGAPMAVSAASKSAVAQAAQRTIARLEAVFAGSEPGPQAAAPVSAGPSLASADLVQPVPPRQHARHGRAAARVAHARFGDIPRSVGFIVDDAPSGSLAETDAPAEPAQPMACEAPV
jgi:hypothetical protein